MRIAIVQSATDIINGSIDLGRLEGLISRLSQPGDFWILPEALDTGWNITDPDSQISGGVADFMERMHAEHGISICGSYYEKMDGGRYSNTFMAVSGGRKYICGKRHMFGDFEKTKVVPGRNLLEFTIDDFRFRAVVCYDLRFPVWCRNRRNEPYDALICVSQWPMQRAADRNLMLAARAMENVAYTINANALGGSQVYAPDGRQDFMMAVGQEVGFYNLDIGNLRTVRDKKKYLLDADDFCIN